MYKQAFGAAAAAVAVTLSLAPLAPPASAASATFTDKAGDVRHGGDLRSVSVANNARNVRVTIRTRDLVADPASGIGGAVYFDTDGDRSPDYAAVGGFFDGTDYALLRTHSWRLDQATERVECSYRMRLDYEADTATFRIATRCFQAVPGSGDVRVAVRTSATSSDGHPRRTDWLGAARTFSRPIPRG